MHDAVIVNRSARQGAWCSIGHFCCALLMLVVSVHVDADDKWSCGNAGDSGGVGPMDYRDRTPHTAEVIKTVERSHFTARHQRFALAGSLKGNVYNNLSYTLRAIPNHHNALFMMGVFQYRLSKYEPKVYSRLKTRNSRYLPVSCWFKRAIGYRPQDVGIYNAQGRVLHMVGNYDGAIDAFKRVTELAPEAPQGHYNLGLAYYSAGKYKRAAAEARRAQELGHTRTELRQRLKRKGFWGK